jgi:hypothetical protein
MLIQSIPFRNLHLLLIFFSLGALAACFHKDVMKDNADNVESPLIYQGPEGDYIICLETIFQANSKSSGGGFTRISGYNDYRLSSYELGTGRLSARIDLGKESDNGHAIVLGQTQGKIWLYSSDKRLGLHCRNPRTLEVMASQDQMAAASSLKTILLATPNPNQLNGYFSFDWESGRPILTDKEGYTYLLNPQDYSIEKTIQKIEPIQVANYFSTYGEWAGKGSAGSGMVLTGDTRKTLQPQGRPPVGDSLSYLFGKIIMDQSPTRAADRMRHDKDSLLSAIHTCEGVIHAYEKANTDALTHIPAQVSGYVNYQQHENDLMDLQQQLHQLGSGPAQMISDDSNTCFIACADRLSDSARLVITKIRQNKDLSCTEIWRCRLGDIYFDRNMAKKNMSNFRTVTSKGNPKYDFQWIDMAGGQLVIISQLKMIGIDMKTGKINWGMDL